MVKYFIHTVRKISTLVYRGPDMKVFPFYISIKVRITLRRSLIAAVLAPHRQVFPSRVGYILTLSIYTFRSLISFCGRTCTSVCVFGSTSVSRLVRDTNVIEDFQRALKRESNPFLQWYVLLLILTEYLYVSITVPTWRFSVYINMCVCVCVCLREREMRKVYI